MFDIGWGELLVIGMVALVAIGPKELPGALRTLGQWMGKIRRMASEFQNQFHEAMREAELAELKKEVDDMASKAASYTHYDPVSEISRDLEKAAGPMPSFDSPPMSGSSTVSSGGVTTGDTINPAAAAETPLSGEPPSEPSTVPSKAPAPVVQAPSSEAPSSAVPSSAAPASGSVSSETASAAPASAPQTEPGSGRAA